MPYLLLLDELRTVTDTVESFEIAGAIFRGLCLFIFILFGPHDCVFLYAVNVLLTAIDTGNCLTYN